MCFSAGASFTTAAILIPAGWYCLQKGRRLKRGNELFALFPLLFGLQQALEGTVWWGLAVDEARIVQLAALGFLFFSHLFWLAWIPLSCHLTEQQPQRRRWFLLLTLVGTLFGGSLFLPLLFEPERLLVSSLNHAILYQTTLLYDAYLPREVITAAYALIVLVPLLLSSERYHRVLGGLVLGSALLTLLIFDYAFISVWCYFAALISLYIYYSLVIQAVPAAPPAATG